jgi:hypothetical protein
MADYPNPKSLKFDRDNEVARCECGYWLQRARACRVCEILTNRGK